MYIPYYIKSRFDPKNAFTECCCTRVCGSASSQILVEIVLQFLSCLIYKIDLTGVFVSP